MSLNAIMLLPILLPIICGLLTRWLPLFKKRAARHFFITTTLAVNIGIVLLLLTQPDLRWEAYRLTDVLTVLFKIDDFSRIFVALASLIWLIAAIYSFEYMKHEENEGRFFMFYLITLGTLIGLGFAGNYMTLYLFFELMTLSSMVMVLHSMTREAIAAALKYLFYSIAGASMSLLAFCLILIYGNSIEFLPGGVLDPEKFAGHDGMLLVGAMLAIIGFGAKAGMFPMHSWLPTAHPVAPAPASAVLSGVITKAGVLAIFRVVFYQFGADFIKGTWVQYAWVILSLITIFMGSTLAFKEQQLKKRLAWSSVSQVSYILFGLSLLTADGMTGALLHMVFHSIVKNGLFFVAGAVIYLTNKTKVSELSAIGKQMPMTMLCFTVLSMSLIGLPPTSGFVSKWYLIVGALKAGINPLFQIGSVVLLVSAVLTAGYLLSICIKGFFPGVVVRVVDFEEREPAWLMATPIAILSVLAIVMGMFPGALISLISNISGQLL